MHRNLRHFAVILVGLASWAVISSPTDAGRIGGPTSSLVTVPGGESVYFDIPFFGDEQAIVSIVGNRRSILQLNVYDGDGHITVGDGYWDRKTAVINVYRPGYFRVEVRNLGIAPNSFTFSTN